MYNNVGDMMEIEDIIQMNKKEIEKLSIFVNMPNKTEFLINTFGVYPWACFPQNSTYLQVDVNADDRNIR